MLLAPRTASSASGAGANVARGARARRGGEPAASASRHTCAPRPHATRRVIHVPKVPSPVETCKAREIINRESVGAVRERCEGSKGRIRATRARLKRLYFQPVSSSPRRSTRFRKIPNPALPWCPDSTTRAVSTRPPGPSPRCSFGLGGCGRVEPVPRARLGASVGFFVVPTLSKPGHADRDQKLRQLHDPVPSLERTHVSPRCMAHAATNQLKSRPFQERRSQFRHGGTP